MKKPLKSKSTLESPESPDSQGNKPHEAPAGGWGSVSAVASIFVREHVVLNGSRVILHQNKPDGFACVSCSWAKPAHPHAVEACENGIKATAWEITSKRTGPHFFAKHTLAELAQWNDYELEEHGRLTDPLRWDPVSDRYLPISWDRAFIEIGEALRKFDPKRVVFYSSGRASLETAYMYQLFARMYGTNNLPDSSNMCHESTSVGLQPAIGVGIGTVVLDDFEATDCIFFFGQNVGINSPRMLHQLQDARKRGVPIVTFNPLRERGLVSFANPLSPVEMLSSDETCISTQYHQVKVGGDIAAITGICKALFAMDDASRSDALEHVLDREFIAAHTQGFDEFESFVRRTEWIDLERESGLARAALEAAAAAYARSRAVIGIYGMGLTQHRRGVENVQMVCNLLLLRGNIGKPGAGICPVRGHSNVQGQRTVGITEKPELAPLDRLAAQYHFEPPREAGFNTVEVCEHLLDKGLDAFVGLGGNFVRAVPETGMVESAWKELPLTVQIATKLNRSHLIHGTVAYLLPCLGRIEIDRQASGPQAVTMEDSTGCMHGSKGVTEPASTALLSEPAIVAGLARATLGERCTVPWEDWVRDYGKIREAIAVTYPEIFHDMSARMWTPGGFRRPVPAAHREWKTKSGKAHFIPPAELIEDPDTPIGPNVLRLTTIRSDDQFNTTLYSLDDRFRGVRGSRRVLFMNVADILRMDLQDGAMVTASTAVGDGVARSVEGMTVREYDIPEGCVAGYFPECNPLIPLWHHAIGSKVPAAKSIPIRVAKAS